MILFVPWNGTAAGETTGPLRKIKDVIVYSDPGYYSSFPSVVVRSDGEILCAFRRAPSRKALYGAPSDLHTDPNSYLVITRSRDNAETWMQEPDHLYAHPLGGSQDPCLLQLRDGTILCTSYAWAQTPEKFLTETTHTLKHPPYAFLGGYLLKSNDGIKWSKPIIPPPTQGSSRLNALGKLCPSYNRGAMVEAADGSILWAVASRMQEQKHTSAHLMRSRDKGENWSYVSPIAADPKISFSETSLVITKDNTLVAFLRTEKNGGRVAMATSTDNGITFTPWKDLGYHGIPQTAMRLPDDRILLVYGYRTPPFGVRARVLKPDVSDASTAPEVILREDGGNVDVGYPWPALMKDGRILVAYYLNRLNGQRHIAGTILELRK